MDSTKKGNIFRLIKPFKGKLRLSRLFYRNQEMLSQSYKVRMNCGVEIVVKNLIDNIGYNIFINGVYEPELVDYLVTFMPKNGCFIDVGANIGAISVPLAYLRPDVSIYCIEASPLVFEYLRFNVELNNLQNITLINKAIHIYDDETLDFFAPADKFGKGSFSNVFTNEAEKVTTIRLDTIINELIITPNIIKVDVEGYESYVFESLSGYLSESKIKPTIIFEFVDWCEKIALGENEIGKAQKILLEQGYKLFEFGNEKKEILEPQKSNSMDIIAF